MKHTILFASLLTTFCIQGFAQTNFFSFQNYGIYTTIQWSQNESTLIIPQAWTYLNDYYFESRYNYEDVKTASLYFGKSITVEKSFNLELIPMLGLVFGQTYGFSPGLNLDFEYRNFSSFTQCQYTINLKDRHSSYYWNWSGFGYNITNYFSLGGSFQIYVPSIGDSIYRVGPMVSFHYKAFTIENYVYNFWEGKPLFAIGLEYQFQ